MFLTDSRIEETKWGAGGHAGGAANTSNNQNGLLLVASNAAGNPMNLSDSNDISMALGNKSPEL